MKVADLKDILKEYPDDMEVLICAGHGQTLESAFRVGYDLVEEDGCYWESVLDDDGNPEEGCEDFEKVLVIES